MLENNLRRGPFNVSDENTFLLRTKRLRINSIPDLASIARTKDFSIINSPGWVGVEKKLI